VTNPAPAWNPGGSGTWQLLNCTVQSVCYSDGTRADSSAADPIIGAPVAGTDTPVAAKLVDLDTEQQLVSEIWGFQVRLGPAAGPNTVVGDYTVAAFTDLWPRATAGGGGDFALGAMYQSVLSNLTWSGGLTSRLLQELRASSPDSLSIKFMVDGFNLTTKQGRLIGTIGPAAPAEPKHFVAARLLRPGNQSPLFFAPCKVNAARRVVTLDLGNSIPTTQAGGLPVNLGTLMLAILPTRGRPTLLGEIHYAAEAYAKTAYIQDFPLTSPQLALLEGHGSTPGTPLGVVQSVPPGAAGFDKTRARARTTVYLQEDTSGTYVRADQFVFRLNPGETATVDLYLRAFGQPVPNQTVTLDYAPDQLPSDPGIAVGTPESALVFSQETLPSDATGKVSFILRASDPGNPRQFIDGQVYGISYTWGAGGNPGSDFLSVLVHTLYTYTGTPTWWQHVQPVLSQYAKLYPFMRNIVDLSDYASVQAHSAQVQQVLRLPRHSPAYMPVTRDLSASKLAMLLQWFADGMPEGTPLGGAVA
jgi:hypothetical protein